MLLVNFQFTFKSSVQVLVVLFMICYFLFDLLHQAKLTFYAEFIYIKRLFEEEEKIEFNNLVNIELNNKTGFPPGSTQYIIDYRKDDSLSARLKQIFYRESRNSCPCTLTKEEIAFIEWSAFNLRGSFLNS